MKASKKAANEQYEDGAEQDEDLDDQDGEDKSADLLDTGAPEEEEEDEETEEEQELEEISADFEQAALDRTTYALNGRNDDGSMDVEMDEEMGPKRLRLDDLLGKAVLSDADEDEEDQDDADETQMDI